MEDRQLLKLLRRDPDAGMEQVMKQYAGLVYAVIRARLAGTDCVSSDAEDCAADVFSEFCAELPKFDPRQSGIKTYLCVLARHNAADIARKRGIRAGDVPLDDADCLLQLPGGEAPDEEVQADELRRTVFGAVQSLGEPDADILMRKYYLGESSKEIADALGLTVSNVDTRTHRALQRLRKTLGGKV